MQQPDPDNQGPLIRQRPLSPVNGEETTKGAEELEFEKVDSEHSPEKREIRSFHKAETTGIPGRHRPNLYD